MERLAASYSKSEEWHNVANNLVDLKFAPKIKVLSWTIASGEKVVASTE